MGNGLFARNYTNMKGWFAKMYKTSSLPKGFEHVKVGYKMEWTTGKRKVCSEALQVGTLHVSMYQQGKQGQLRRIDLRSQRKT